MFGFRVSSWWGGVLFLVSTFSAVSPAGPETKKNLTRLLNVVPLLEEKFPGAIVEPTAQSGAFSLTYRIRTEQNELYLAKVLRPLTDMERPYASHRKEAAFLSRMAHDPELVNSLPPLVGLLDLPLDGETLEPVVVLHYSNGGTLHEDKSLSFFAGLKPSELLKYWLQISEPLAVLRRKYGIIHTDIKSKNMVLQRTEGERFRFWIIDWGEYTTIEAGDPARGTPLYLHRSSLIKSNPDLNNVRGLQMTFLEMASGIALQHLLDSDPNCSELLRWPSGEFRYLVQIPRQLRRRIHKSLLSIIEGQFSNVEELNAKIKATGP